LCGLAVPSNWNDRPKDISQENWENLKLAYDDVADIDAFTGGVSEDSVSNGIVGSTFACILAEQFKNLKRGDRFFFTHKETGLRKERGWSKSERKQSQIQLRKLSDIICDNIVVETIPKNVFKADSNLIKCQEKSKLFVSSKHAKESIHLSTTTTSSITTTSSTTSTSPTKTGTTTEGIFIAGGIHYGGAYFYRKSIGPAFYNPITNKYCEINRYMTPFRSKSTTTGFTSCGGCEWNKDSSYLYNCKTFDPIKGRWRLTASWDPSKYPHRTHGTAWKSSIGLFLISGEGAESSSMLINPSGEVSAGFPVEHGKSQACAVADPRTDTVIIIGGRDKSGAATDTVYRYNVKGSYSKLPSLRKPRRYLGCSGYYNDKENLVLVVSNGIGVDVDDGVGYTTEHLEVGVDTNWKFSDSEGAAFCANPNNNVYCLGGFKGTDLQKYNPSTGGFEKKQTVHYWRYQGPLASPVPIDSGIENWCK